jgi:hypothetical protein
MLRLSRILSTAVAAGALFVSYPAFAQAGLGQRLDAKEQQLTQDEQTCREVNLAEYAQLLQEATQNKVRADKAAKKGVPVNQAQVDADLAKAMQLFARAQMAQARQCMMQAQQQAQPQTSPPAPQAGQTPATAPGGQGAAGLNSRLDDAEKKLADDIKACRPVKPGDYQPLVDEMRRNLKAGRKALESGAPVDVDKLLSDSDRASKLLESAKAAEAEQSKVCPPKREAQTEPPSPAPPKQTSTNLPRWAQDMLAAHNAARAAVGSPPLNWDPVLQEHATARAQEMAQERQLVHASREGRGTERENILEAPLSYSPTQMIKVWTDESRHFVPGIFPNVCDTGGDCSNVWHYTQVVSYLSTDIGCGYAEGGGFNWLVCRYNPGGNKDGKPVLSNSWIRPRLTGGDYGQTGGAPPLPPPPPPP